MKPAHMESGSASIELALVLLCMVMMIAPLVLFGRIFWQHGVLKSACLQGASMVATAPSYVFTVSATRNALVSAAQKAVKDGAILGGIKEEDVGAVSISCDGGGPCGLNTPPGRINMSYAVLLTDPIFPDLSVRYMPDDLYQLDIRCELPYASSLPREVAP